MTFGVWVLFGSLRGRVRFGLIRVLANFSLSGSVRFFCKMWVLVRFVLAGFGFFPISNRHRNTAGKCVHCSFLLLKAHHSVVV